MRIGASPPDRRSQNAMDGRNVVAVFRRADTYFVLVIVLASMLLASVVVASSFGALDVPFPDALAVVGNRLFGIGLPADGHIASSSENVVWELRFPRILLGMGIGAGLGVAGVVMQASVQNTLAEPYILGVSSGASFGATFAIMLGAGSLRIAELSTVPLFAFVGSLAATFGVLLLASAGSKMTASKLVLAGLVVNALFMALSNFVITIAADAEGMLDLKFWTMGSLARADWDNIWPTLAVIGAGCLFFLSQFRALNILLMGDEAASTLGLNTVARRWVYLSVSALMVASMVAAAGTVGFVGLVVPHIVRSFVGPDHRRLLPAAILFGAVFMVWADAFARTLLTNVEIPIGVLTAAIGAPFFAYVMVAHQYSFRGN